MAALYRFDLEDGGSVLVELAEQPGVEPAARKRAIPDAAKVTFEKALIGVRDAAASALAQFQAMKHQPDEVEISFGVKLEATTGAVIAQTGVQGHIEVKLRWQRSGSQGA
jgi:hypothetical protein